MMICAEKALKDEKTVNITHVAVIHSETTSGILNNIEAIGQVSSTSPSTLTRMHHPVIPIILSNPHLPCVLG